MASSTDRHPEESRLALYSSGDLNPVERFLIRLHVRTCARCATQVDSFNVTSSVLRSQMTKMPQGVEWDRLAAEMTANIHLGLEAGECVGPVRAARVERIGWRAAIVMAGLSVVLAGAWLLNPPRRAETLVRTSPIEIRTSPGRHRNAGKRLRLDPHAHARSTAADYRKYAGVLAGPVRRSGHWSGHDQ